MMFNKSALFILAMSAFAFAAQPSENQPGSPEQPSLPVPIPPNGVLPVVPAPSISPITSSNLKRHNGYQGFERRSKSGNKKSGSGAPGSGSSKKPSGAGEGGSATKDKVIRGSSTAPGETQFTCASGTLTCCMTATKDTEEGQRQVLAAMNIPTKKVLGPFIGTACKDVNADGEQCQGAEPLCCEAVSQVGTGNGCAAPTAAGQ